MCLYFPIRRVLIYPTKPFCNWLNDNHSELAPTSRSKFYVAITRARYSVGIIYDFNNETNIDGVGKYSPRTIWLQNIFSSIELQEDSIGANSVHTAEDTKECQTKFYTLTHMRDTLLPKLMSGEVRVNYLEL